MQVDKVIETLHAYINNYELANLREYWQVLDRRLFSRLELIYSPTVRKLEVSLLKLYVINAIQSGKSDMARDFFEKMAAELQGQPEWKEWFGKKAFAKGHIDYVGLIRTNVQLQFFKQGIRCQHMYIV